MPRKKDNTITLLCLDELLHPMLGIAIKQTPGRNLRHCNQPLKHIVFRIDRQLISPQMVQFLKCLFHRITRFCGQNRRTGKAHHFQILIQQLCQMLKANRHRIRRLRNDLQILITLMHDRIAKLRILLQLLQMIAYNRILLGAFLQQNIERLVFQGILHPVQRLLTARIRIQKPLGIAEISHCPLRNRRQSLSHSRTQASDIPLHSYRHPHHSDC